MSEIANVFALFSARSIAMRRRLPAYLLAFAGMWLAAIRAGADEPLALRVESLLLPPSAGPLVMVDVHNPQKTAYQGNLAVKGPAAWRISPPQQVVSLKAGETKRVQFAVDRGVSDPSNAYPFEVSATASGTSILKKQLVHCATAPYYKPTIDGDPAEWKDAIPITFLTAGKKTTLATYWNRQQFAILVAVEEDQLVGYQENPGPRGFDAVQVAIAPQGSTAGNSPEALCTRWEFLFVAGANGGGAKCFRLAEPGMTLAEAQKPRKLGSLAYDKASVAVSRKGGITYYECAIPFAPMKQEIRPSEGREFCLSVLVHDPDGTGIRDWGEAAGLWPWQRNRLAWSRWEGAVWRPQPPFDNKLAWGLCASKY